MCDIATELARSIHLACRSRSVLSRTFRLTRPSSKRYITVLELVVAGLYRPDCDIPMTTIKRIPRQEAFPLPPPPLPDTDPNGNHGEFFTRPWVVDLILDLSGFDESSDLCQQTLVEPACGDGAFVRRIARRLIGSSREHGRPLEDATDAVRAYDLQRHNVMATRRVVLEEFESAGMSHESAEEIAQAWVHHGDFLLTHHESDGVDYVIGNPPYVRPEDVPDERMALYRQRCSTMTGRADVYIGFYEVGLEMLKDGGVLGFICADRWMRNSYGKKLRAMIADGYAVEVALEMHDVDAFADEVSAYPAITVLRRAQQSSVLVATATAGFGSDEGHALIDWTRTGPEPGSSMCLPSGTRVAMTYGWYSGGSSWPTGSPQRLALLRDLESRFGPLERGSTRVGIGVATGADAVFITSDASVVEKDRLLPLVLTKDTVSGTLAWDGHYLVNPWRSGGGVVDLDEFPRLRSYFEEHSDRLLRRHIAGKRPTQWYRTIDPVNHELTRMPKLLFPDMKMASHPVLDPGGHYPHHNLYYVISDDWDLEVLGGLLLSRVAQFFIESYAVRMRGGTLRFQAQYLRRIRVPEPGTLSEVTSSSLRSAFRDRDVERATKHAFAAYGIESLPE